MSWILAAWLSHLRFVGAKEIGNRFGYYHDLSTIKVDLNEHFGSRNGMEHSAEVAEETRRPYKGPRTSYKSPRTYGK